MGENHIDWGRGLRSLLGGIGQPKMRLSREAVIWGFRFFLGREPESEAVIDKHRTCRNETVLARRLIASPEFAQKRRFPELGTSRPAHSRALAASSRRFASANVSLTVFGNCQAQAFANLLQAMAGGGEVTVIETTPGVVERLRSGDLDLAALVDPCDLILLQEIGPLFSIIQEHLPQALHKVRRFPSLHFNAYHPDIVYVEDTSKGGFIQGPMGEYQSAIVLWAWMNGLGIDETVRLFRREVFAALGYFDFWPGATNELYAMGDAAGIPVGDLLERWRRRGCWLYSINHPKQYALADVARRVLVREGIAPLPEVEELLPDPLAAQPVWPVYSELGERLGIPGSYLFKITDVYGSLDNPVSFLGLADFIATSFETFASYGPDRLHCERLGSPRYQLLQELALTGRTLVDVASTLIPSTEGPASTGQTATLDNPYRGLPDYQFWRRAVERVELKDFDPIVRPRVQVRPGDRVATAGSCFAQHIARTLRLNGLGFFDAELPGGLGSEEALHRQYGVFSARYGNIYTARQLLQLFDRAFGYFTPADDCWVRPDGRLVDAFRPQVEPDGFDSHDEVAQARADHLLAVRTLFEGLDVFIFTLGLTEAWRSRRDGAVYPLAPGVVAGRMDTTHYEFVNFNCGEVVTDLQSFSERLRAINPLARIILTVSPVPLIATYEDRHVLVATTYSKSVLRVAADEVVRADPLSDYFPSFELITGNQARGDYFTDDLRSVSPAGVEHVMRIFLTHYVSTAAAPRLDEELALESERLREIICDEEAIEAAGCRN